MRLSRPLSALRSTAVALLLMVSTLTLFSADAGAATLTVCASGCAYADLQRALDAAQPGDTILLRAGETFIGHFTLPVKSNPSGTHILIRSDAPDSAFPPAGTRLIPPGRPGANVSASALPKLRGRGGQWKTTPVLRPAPGAHHYRLQFLEIDGVAQEGWGTLVALGTNNASEQSTLSQVPHSIVFDRVYVHGHPFKGQIRCIALNGRNIDILNSHVSSCATFGADSQAIGGFNGPGPFRILNNYLEGSGENIMFGGADPAIQDLVPSDIEIRRNHIAKPVAWRQPILAAPSAPAASVLAGSGSLASGTHYFTVVAVMDSHDHQAFSAQSPERAVTVSTAGSSVRLTWNAVAGADRYRVYRGTQSGGQNRYLETSAALTAHTYSGTGENSSTPRAAGTRWTVKNLLELKNAQRVLIDGNLFESVWAEAQRGFALLLTPRNQDGRSPWTVVRDVTVTNNIIRRAAGGIVILGQDYLHPSQRTERITIRNNLLYDISYEWGASSHFLQITQSPRDVRVDHNTVFLDDKSVVIDDGASSGFVFTNNLMPHNQYGIFGSGAGSGTAAMQAYFPDGVLRRNAFGGGPESKYPPDNFFPDMPTFLAQFVNPGARDYRLVSASSFRGAGTDGKDLGVDFGALNAAQAGTPPPSVSSGPYGGTPVALPGLIQAENFDEGGANTAYYDTTSGNSGGRHRSTDVDIEGTSDAGGGFNVGWMAPGEWLKYTVSVSTAGTYDLEFRVASTGGGGSFHLEANGTNKTGTITIPNTGGWQNWTTVRKTGVSLSAGRQVWRFVVGAAGPSGNTLNLNSIRVASGSGGSTPPSSGGDIVLYGSDVTRMAGNWSRVSSSSGAGGQAMQSQDRGWSTTSAPRAAPADYFEMSFTPEANRAYRLWIRMRGQADSKWNESVWVQFSGALAAGGAQKWPIGSTSALLVNLEACAGCGISGWGWQNKAYWLTDDTTVRFASASTQTIRIQTREDGAQVDQVVLSPVTYFDRSPGGLRNDSTIVPKAGAGSEPPPSSGPDVVLYASDVSRMAGNWTRMSSTTGAGGQKMQSADRGWSTPEAPRASPADYFEVTFTPEANRAYRVWLRLRAASNSKWNDSVWVQFSGAVTSTGSALWRIGSTNGLLVNLENCSECGVAGWGWQDTAWWTGNSSIVRFLSATPQTIRIQTREDGVDVDQIVLSPVKYLDQSPGAVSQDATIVPK